MAAQQAARDVMPLAAMHAAVSDAAHLARDMGDTASILDDQTALVIEMLAWFKQDFFSWVRICSYAHASLLVSRLPALHCNAERSTSSSWILVFCFVIIVIMQLYHSNF